MNINVTSVLRIRKADRWIFEIRFDRPGISLRCEAPEDYDTMTDSERELALVRGLDEFVDDLAISRLKLFDHLFW